ncbi:MAG: hypothetical protein WCL21_08985 [Mariniphaga sp.]
MSRKAGDKSTIICFLQIRSTGAVTLRCPGFFMSGKISETMVKILDGNPWWAAVAHEIRPVTIQRLFIFGAAITGSTIRAQIRIDVFLE